MHRRVWPTKWEEKKLGRRAWERKTSNSVQRFAREKIEKGGTTFGPTLGKSARKVTNKRPGESRGRKKPASTRWRGTKGRDSRGEKSLRAGSGVVHRF